jgi:hypothetical protein
VARAAALVVLYTQQLGQALHLPSKTLAWFCSLVKTAFSPERSAVIASANDGFRSSTHDGLFGKDGHTIRQLKLVFAEAWLRELAPHLTRMQLHVVSVGLVPISLEQDQVDAENLLELPAVELKSTGLADCFRLVLAALARPDAVSSQDIFNASFSDDVPGWLTNTGCDASVILALSQQAEFAGLLTSFEQVPPAWLVWLEELSVSLVHPCPLETSRTTPYTLIQRMCLLVALKPALLLESAIVTYALGPDLGASILQLHGQAVLTHFLSSPVDGQHTLLTYTCSLQQALEAVQSVLRGLDYRWSVIRLLSEDDADLHLNLRSVDLVVACLDGTQKLGACLERLQTIAPKSRYLIVTADLRAAEASSDIPQLQHCRLQHDVKDVASFAQQLLACIASS